MAVGNWYWIDRALAKLGDGTLDLDAQTVKMALCNSTQAITRSFTGASGDARYADLTGQLATLDGYTVGGVTLPTPAVTRPSATVNRFSSGAAVWTLTSVITFKYPVIYVDGATNKDLLMVCDFEDTGGSFSPPGAGMFYIKPDVTDGWGTWSQP
jgi:hypothetical protein